MMRQNERIKQEIGVVTKIYDFTLWLLPHTGQFSRAHRFTLGTRLEDTTLEVLEILVEAGYARDKQELLQRANRRSDE